MRIAVIGTVSSSMVSFRGQFLHKLSEAGHTVLAFAIDYDEDGEAAVRAQGAYPVRYSLDRTGTHPLRDLYSTWQLQALFREHGVDRVFSYFIKPAVYGTLAAQLASVKRCDVMLPGLGFYFTDGTTRRPWRKRIVAGMLKALLRYSLHRNARVIIYNLDDAEELTNQRLVRPSQLVQVNGTGIDLEAYTFSEPVTQPVTFVMAARLLASKGVLEYLAAAQQVKQRHPEVRFVLLGERDTSPDGISEDQIRRFVSEGILEWPGRVPDIRPWLQSASVYVLPSYREGVPRSTQEALAIGRPVITTDTIGCRETVIDGENGFLVPLRDANALASKMITFIERPKLIKRMGEKSRALAESRFDVHKINAELFQILDIA
jgi:glycosyltransferase involved in cell wall biosynthesis